MTVAFSNQQAINNRCGYSTNHSLRHRFSCNPQLSFWQTSMFLNMQEILKTRRKLLNCFALIQKEISFS